MRRTTVSIVGLTAAAALALTGCTGIPGDHTDKTPHGTTTSTEDLVEGPAADADAQPAPDAPTPEESDDFTVKFGQETA